MEPYFSRRLLLRSGLGGVTIGAVAIAAGCSGSTTTDATSEDETSSDPQASESDTAASSDGARSTASTGSWERVELSFVSAYVFVRSGQATVVDTGTSGSEHDIEDVLASAGLDWGDVSDVILTHSHEDHVGSAAAIAQAAPEAMFHAGVPDLPAIDVGRDVSGVRDGDTVAELSIIATPGHTPGHLCVHDVANGVLVTGDALTGRGGRVGLPVRDFTADYEEALRSVDYLGSFDFATALFGHGAPVDSGASAQVRALAAGG
ncbi:hypothetical protein BH23ACT6_BH23ACT6_21130 [soil metagenome]